MTNLLVDTPDSNSDEDDNEDEDTKTKTMTMTTMVLTTIVHQLIHATFMKSD
jgi:hypothetical protein